MLRCNKELQKEVPGNGDDLMSSLRASNEKCNWLARVRRSDDRKYRREHGHSKNDIEEAFGSLYLFECGFYAEKIREHAMKMMGLVN